MVYAAGYDDSNDTGKVSIINGNTDKLVGNIEIDVDNFEQAAIAVNPATHLVFVADFGSGRLAIIGPNSTKTFGTAYIQGLSGLLVDPSRNLLYLVNNIDDQVDVRNGSNLAPISKISLPFRPIENIDSDYPSRMTINPTSNMIYDVGYDNNTNTYSVFVLNGNTHKLAANIETKSQPIKLAIDPANNLVYAVNLDDTASLINGTTNELISEGVKIGDPNPTATGDLSAMAINPATDRVYYSFDNDHNKIVVMDPNKMVFPYTLNIPASHYYNLSLYVTRKAVNFSAIDSFMRNFPVPIKLVFNTENVAFNPFTGLAYVVNYNDNSVSIINASTRYVIATISVGNGPDSIAINSDTNLVYVANYFDNSVSVINASTRSPVTTISVGNGPDNIAINSDTNLVYVANYFDNSVSVINASTNKLEATIEVGLSPEVLSIDPASNIISVFGDPDYKASFIDGKTNNVSRIEP